MPGEEEAGEDEQSLKDQAAGGGEGIPAAEVAALMKAVEGLEPSGRFFAKVPQAGEIIGEHGSDRPRQKQVPRDGGKSGRAEQNQKHKQSHHLIRDGHWQKAGEFGFPVRGGVYPVADAGIPVGNCIQGKVAEDSG